MIKKLRTRFIMIAMCSMIGVLAVIMTAINITNYHQVMDEIEQTMTLLSENGGDFPQEGQQKPEDTPQYKPSAKPEELPADKAEPPHQKENGGGKEMSPEKPYSTRYFTVLLNQQGEVVETNMKQIAAVSSLTAQAIAKEQFAAGETHGFYDNYRFRQIQTDQGILYIFLDCDNDLATFRSFLWISIGVSAGGIALVFVLVFIFSGIAMKPIAESYEKQKQFITDAGHELKTPLTIIDANTEVLEMERGESPWLDSIRNQVKRLSDLTQKLVFLSRMEEEKTVLSFTDFSLTDAVYETAKPFEAVAAAQEKTLEIQCKEGVSYRGDEATLRQLVSLLLDNALKYSGEKGAVAIVLDEVGKKKQLTITNTVDQIGPDSPALWFDRFYRQESSRNSKTGGHGIGLSVAKAIVTSHKGKISAAYKNGNQVVITVIL